MAPGEAAISTLPFLDIFKPDCQRMHSEGLCCGAVVTVGAEDWPEALWTPCVVGPHSPA